MSSLLRGFILKQLGIQEIIDDTLRDLAGADPEIIKLLMPKRYAPVDSKQELLNLAKQLGINAEIKDSKEPIDEVRRATAISSNVTPLNIENPLDVLWQIAMHFKGDINANNKNS
ncbi:hypothetical protein [Acidianus manzaensis]|uniref:Uncharacterized protein n=1 Tax=Acidianus manzaensis TaxID=282676 RepID=A0A1W6JYL4_9CREN|nr:hypothetical protein [Acidianus manzaensis]ARM75332.1 hypothetical protein B6F84_04315 [Acidianus manzaensis]